MENNFSEIFEDVTGRILSHIPKELTYHNLHHTVDVLQQAERIAREEGVGNKEDLLILKIAALYHDAGFLHTREGHEEEGCKMARRELPAFGINENQLDKICSMIMATKIPRSPKNKLEEILCDADLDYLGRNDFFKIAHHLFIEMKNIGLVNSEPEWNKLQLQFLKEHHYFTPTNKKYREPQKQKNIALIEEMI